MTAVTEARTWTLGIRGPAQMYSTNTREHWRTTGTAKKAWREAAFIHAKKAKLPCGLDRVRIDIVLHFVDRKPRDAANFHPTVGKPLVDGLGAERFVTTKNGVRHEVGYRLIPDDTPQHLDGPHLTIGEPVSPKAHPFGLAVVTITDLSEAAS